MGDKKVRCILGVGESEKDISFDGVEGVFASASGREN
jgi:hypothetical protein